MKVTIVSNGSTKLVLKPENQSEILAIKDLRNAKINATYHETMQILNEASPDCLVLEVDTTKPVAPKEENVPTGKVDSIEIHPLIGLDEHNNPVKNYAEVKGFAQCEEGDVDVLCWGVYLHRKGAGLENVFDVPDRENAEQAKALLEKLYNL